MRWTNDTCVIDCINLIPTNCSLYTYKVKVKIRLTWYTANIIALRVTSEAVYTLTSQPGTHPKPTQPWCEYYLVWANISWWWDQVSALHPIQGQHHPVLPHRAGTSFTPWWGEAHVEFTSCPRMLQHSWA